jgi:aspartyl-tRNA(Asn)/glutamyl-tRNA(Gln) amidotransferase subunit A
MTDLADLTATELLSLFASKEATPADAVQACLDRIDAVDSRLNAILVNLGPQALAAAEESAARWADGTARPLEGIPFGLKDIIATEGVPTTGGSALFTDNVPGTDAALAARLKAAGGILLAKLHTFEFACGGAENRTFGPCRNPWNTAHTTGGSSSGSGAAVAAGEVPLAIGTDTGGSIRIPAAYCGITGLKPTYGRVPRHGVMGLSWTLDHAGPMTRSVADAALMLGVIAGHDLRDSYSSRRPVPDYSESLAASVAGLVLGRPRGWFEDPGAIQPAILAAVDAAAAAYEALGVPVVDVELPDIDLWDIAAWSVCYPETLSYHQHHVYDVENRDAMGAGMLAASPYVHAVDYLRALRYRPIAQGQLETAMAGVSALIVPGASSVAPPLAEISTTEDSAGWLIKATRVMIPFNYTGNPALSLPSGVADGLPTSVQLVGRPHDEATLFALGSAFQSATGHHLARPALRTAAG